MFTSPITLGSNLPTATQYRAMMKELGHNTKMFPVCTALTRGQYWRPNIRIAWTHVCCLRDNKNFAQEVQQTFRNKGYTDAVVWEYKKICKIIRSCVIYR